MLIVALLLLSAIGILYCVVLLRHEVTKKRGRENLAVYEKKVQDYLKRTALLKQHTHDYFNSLDKDGMRGLAEMENIERSLSAIVVEMHNLIADNDYKSLHEILSFISGENSQPTSDITRAVSSEFPELRDWENRLEELIQTVGKHVAEASKEYQQLGIVKNKRKRKRQPTLMSLKQAGVETDPNTPQ